MDERTSNFPTMDFTFSSCPRLHDKSIRKPLLPICMEPGDHVVGGGGKMRGGGGLNDNLVVHKEQLAPSDLAN